LEDCAVNAGVPLMVRTLHRQESVGRCTDGVPRHAMNVRQRLDSLREELPCFKGLYETNKPEYNKRAADLYSRLRETWEAFIELNLLYKTVVRHGSQIQTKSLQYVTVEDEDYKKIHLGMGKCSTWMTGHDKSKALSEDRPNPEEILTDIEGLAKYVKDTNGRNVKLKDRRDKMLQPAQAPIG